MNTKATFKDDAELNAHIDEKIKELDPDSTYTNVLYNCDLNPRKYKSFHGELNRYERDYASQLTPEHLKNEFVPKFETISFKDEQACWQSIQFLQERNEKLIYLWDEKIKAQIKYLEDGQLWNMGDYLRCAEDFYYRYQWDQNSYGHDHTVSRDYGNIEEREIVNRLLYLDFENYVFPLIQEKFPGVYENSDVFTEALLSQSMKNKFKIGKANQNAKLKYMVFAEWLWKFADHLNKQAKPAFDNLNIKDDYSRVEAEYLEAYENYYKNTDEKNNESLAIIYIEKQDALVRCDVHVPDLWNFKHQDHVNTFMGCLNSNVLENESRYQNSYYFKNNPSIRAINEKTLKNDKEPTSKEVRTIALVTKMALVIGRQDDLVKRLRVHAYSNRIETPRPVMSKNKKVLLIVTGIVLIVTGVAMIAATCGAGTPVGSCAVAAGFGMVAAALGCASMGFGVYFSFRDNWRVKHPIVGTEPVYAETPASNIVTSVIKNPSPKIKS